MQYSLVKWSELFYKKHKINGGNNWFEYNYDATNEETLEKIKNSTLPDHVIGCLDFVFLPLFKNGKLSKAFKNEIPIISKIYSLVCEKMGGSTDAPDIVSILEKEDFFEDRFNKSTHWYLHVVKYYDDLEYEELEKFRDLVCFCFLLLSFLVDVGFTFKKTFFTFLTLLFNVLKTPKEWVLRNNVDEAPISKNMFFTKKTDELSNNYTIESYMNLLVDETGRFEVDAASISNVIYNVSGVYFKSMHIKNFMNLLNILNIFHIRTLSIETEHFKIENSSKIAGLDYLNLNGLIDVDETYHYKMTPYIELTLENKLTLLFLCITEKKGRIQFGEGQTIELNGKLIRYDCVKVDTEIKHACLEVKFHKDNVSIEYHDDNIEPINEDMFVPFAVHYEKKFSENLQKSIIRNKDERKLVNALTHLLELKKWDNYFKVETSVYFNETDLETLRNLVRDWDDSEEMQYKLQNIFNENILNNHHDNGGYKHLYYSKHIYAITNTFNLEELVYGVIPFVFVFLLKLSNKSDWEEISKISDVFVKFISNIVSTSLSASDNERVLEINMKEIEKTINLSLKEALQSINK